MHLIGDALALRFDDAEKMPKALDTLRPPFGAFECREPGAQIPDTCCSLPRARRRMTHDRANEVWVPSTRSSTRWAVDHSDALGAPNLSVTNSGIILRRRAQISH